MPTETGIIIALRRRIPIEVAGQRVRDLGIAAEAASAAADGFAASFVRLHVMTDRRRLNRARRRLARSLVAHGASSTDATWYARREWPR